MKKVFLLLFLGLFSMNYVCADNKFVIHVETSGTLIDLIGVSNVNDVQELIISGDLNGTDILTIRKMINLTSLDMTNANIVSGGSSYYATYTTSANMFGDYFFMDKTNLSVVILPNTITEIGSHSFQGCVNLKSLTIGSSVAIIRISAFYGCSGLSSLIIPNSVTLIEQGAFQNCSSLKNVIMEDGGSGLAFRYYSTLMPGKAFENCPIETLYMGRVMSYTSDDSPFKEKITLTSLTIGNSVTSIGKSAFYGCSGLSGTLTIPNSVTSIGENAFLGCSGLSGTLTIPNSVTSIKGGAFSGCSQLNNIVVEDGTTTLSFEDTTLAFENCLIENLYLGRNVSYINNSMYNFSPFAHTTLKSLTIGNSVTSIGVGAFQFCSGLTSLTIGNAVTSIGTSAFYGCSGLSGTLTIPNSVTSIGGSAFSLCSGLSGTLIIPNSVTSIGEGAFSVCSGLSGTLSIPSSITTIENSTFRGCSELTSLIIPNSVTLIGVEAFSGCSGLSGTLIIPNSVTSIGESAFSGCSGLSGTLTIPNSITSIENSTFSDCSRLTSLIIPNSVTLIGVGAFSGCSGLTEITIPNSVSSIGRSAFSACSQLNSIIVEDGTTNLVFETGGYLGNVFIPAITFDNCPIESLYLGRNISYNYPSWNPCSPFMNRTTLASLTIGYYVTLIGDFAFSGCSGLMEINSKNQTPPQAQSNTFEGVDKEACTLYVPIGCTTIYWLHPVWEDFFNIQEKDFPLPTSINNIVSDSEISASITSEGIKITGCNPLDRINIYTVNGQLVYSSVVGNGLISYPLQRGVYIIHTPKKSLKVIY